MRNHKTDTTGGLFIMKIGEVIRKYRKEKGLTQEEMAGRLGVSAPAVNKWENNVSMPDVSLLAPIARLLEITTDTLLSYKDELTDIEMNQKAEEFARIAMEEHFDSAWDWAQKQVQEYPNSEKLIMLMVQMMDGYRMILGVKDVEKYTPRLYELYERLLHSDNVEIRQEAAVSFFHNCLRDNNFEKAEECLSCVPKRSFNLKLLQAKLCNAKKESEEAKRLYEEVLYAGYMDITGGFNGLYAMAVEEHDEARAEMLAEKEKAFIRLMEMGRYQELAVDIDRVLGQKDKEKTLDYLENLTEHLDSMTDFRKSSLYSHIKFSDGGMEGVVQMLKQSLENDESLDFVRKEERFGRIMKKLEAFIGDK